MWGSDQAWMNEAVAAAAWGGGCICSELQARVSLAKSHPGCVDSCARHLRPSAASAIQDKGFVARFPSFTMPCVVGEKDCPSSFILCVLFGTLDPLVGSLWPCAYRPPPPFRSFGTRAFLPPRQTGDHLSAPPAAMSFILLNMPTESNHD